MVFRREYRQTGRNPPEEGNRCQRSFPVSMQGNTARVSAFPHHESSLLKRYKVFLHAVRGTEPECLPDLPYGRRNAPPIDAGSDEFVNLPLTVGDFVFHRALLFMLAAERAEIARGRMNLR